MNWLVDVFYTVCDECKRQQQHQPDDCSCRVHPTTYTAADYHRVWPLGNSLKSEKETV